MTRDVICWFIVAMCMAVNAYTQSLGQTSSMHGFIALNGTYQLTSTDFVDGAARRVNAEDGRIDTTYNVKGGPGFDIAGGARVFRHLGLGIGVSRFSTSTPAAIAGSVPHPFFFNRLRSVSGSAPGLTREELVVHVQARGIFEAGSRLEVMVFGGPSFFKVNQAVVTDFTLNESYPFDDATFNSARTTDAKVSHIGFNAGGDVTFFFARQLGVGATVQFAGAKVQLPGAGAATQEVNVGGGKVGVGVRIRF
jgi:hypothetical protein